MLHNLLFIWRVMRFQKCIFSFVCPVDLVLCFGGGFITKKRVAINAQQSAALLPKDLLYLFNG